MKSSVQKYTDSTYLLCNLISVRRGLRPEINVSSGTDLNHVRSVKNLENL